MDLKVEQRLFKISILSALTLYLSSCNGVAHEEYALMEKSTKTNNLVTTTEGIEQKIEADRDVQSLIDPLKIVKTAKVKYKVKHVKLATQQIKRTVQAYNGYLSDLHYKNNLYQLESRFTLKVPKVHFDTMLDSIATVAEFIEFETISSKDVTEAYIDVEARLKTKREVKERYELVLKEKSETVKDILDTEEKLQLIQEEIDAAQGKLDYLAHSIAYSTIEIIVYQTVEYQEEPIDYEKGFWSKSKEGLVFGWRAVEGLLIGMLHLWPLFPIGLLVFLFIRKRRSQKNGGA